MQFYHQFFLGTIFILRKGVLVFFEPPIPLRKENSVLPLSNSTWCTHICSKFHYHRPQNHQFHTQLFLWWFHKLLWFELLRLEQLKLHMWWFEQLQLVLWWFEQLKLQLMWFEQLQLGLWLFDQLQLQLWWFEQLQLVQWWFELWWFQLLKLNM